MDLAYHVISVIAFTIYKVHKKNQAFNTLMQFNFLILFLKNEVKWDFFNIWITLRAMIAMKNYVRKE